MIYLDNAATSCTKPESVYEAVNDALRNASGNPGRSGHRLSLKAGAVAEEARLTLSRLFHAENAQCIVFTSNATEALNTAIFGLVKPGDHVITSSMEHNSVARPLEFLRTLGVEVTKLPASIDDGVDPEDLKKALKDNTRLVVINHISNVTGTVNPIETIGEICRKEGIPFLADASQSAGTLPIDVQEMKIDLLAFPGHKSLLGPQGTGALYIRPGIEPDPLKRGGTGSRSELLTQPEILPDKFESGTINVPGIAGLGAGAAFILKEGPEKIHEKEQELMDLLIQGLGVIPGVRIYAPGPGKKRGSVLSFTMDEKDPQEVSLLLDEAFDIAVRAGLHCAPDAHRTIGTLETGGTVRVSPGYYNTKEEIEAFLAAVDEIARA